MLASQLNDNIILLMKRPLTHYWTSPLKMAVKSKEKVRVKGGDPRHYFNWMAKLTVIYMQWMNWGIFDIQYARIVFIAC